MPGGHKNIKPSDNPKPFNTHPENIGNGRKKKIYTILKEKGYSADDIRAAFNELAFYDTENLKKVMSDDSMPVIVRIVAHQFLKALKDSDWAKIREILEHVIGKAPAIVGVIDDEEKIKQIFKIGDQEIEF